MKDISFVVQGNINPRTKICLESIRYFYPVSPIILSTWENEPIADLTYDILIINKDPGAVEFRPGAFNNVNRQIVSTANGLHAASTTYAVKMRTDTQFVDRSLPQVLENLSEAHLFSKKIAALNLFFRDPRKWPLLFHIGDIFQAGQTEDLRNLWTIPLAPQPATSLSPNLCNRIFSFDRAAQSRYVPEQYVFVSFLNKLGLPVSLEYCFELTIEKAAISEREIATNFSIFSPDFLGIHIPFRFVEHGAPTLLYTPLQLEDISKNGIDINDIRRYVMKRRRRMISDFLRRPHEWSQWLKGNFDRYKRQADSPSDVQKNQFMESYPTQYIHQKIYHKNIY